jgi:hypothetical protein
MMKLIHSAVLALAIGGATVSTAQARDSFSLGINVSDYGYAPPVAYYPAPVYYSEPVYYSQPVTYYRPAPRYYSYAPTVVSFGYQNYGGYSHHGGHHGWDRGRGHDDRGNGGWERGGDRHGSGHHDGHR